MVEAAKEIFPVNLEDEMRQSYLDYAMSVIVGRALPDVRDGLKPVHRRVLFAMRELGNDYNKAYKKSARVVGDVIGKYHPHGESAVYDAIVRLAQNFSMRYMLVDGQGNFGSVDGDAPAAMRYTEVRMAKMAQELLADIEKETVDFTPNYDESESEPSVLPTRVPNLLVNGSSGIAVYGAKIALTVDQHVPHRKALGHPDNRVVDRGFAMRMIFADHVTDDARRLLVRLVVFVPEFAHRKQDTPVHRLEPISDIGQCPAHNDAHRIVEIRLAHLVFEIDREDFFGGFYHSNAYTAASCSGGNWPQQRVVLVKKVAVSRVFASTGILPQDACRRSYTHVRE
jgi:hypothetical protein